MARLQPRFDELRLETPWPLEGFSALKTPIGHSGWSLLLGFLSGGLGGIAMLSLAQHVLTLRGFNVDLAELLSSSRGFAAVQLGTARQEAFVGAGLIGAALGAPLGYLARRLVRLVPRVLFFALLTPILWTFVHACLLGTLAPEVARSLPFVPLVAGACAYALCMAIVPPIRAKQA